MRNRAPAVVLHDPQSVLHLGPAELRADAGWDQDDSDTVGHFIQVTGQLATSTWVQKKVTLNDRGDQSLGTFPDLESFVYVAVYFRQLMSEQDKLFVDACDLYIQAVDSPGKAAWMHQEKEAALTCWSSPTDMMPEVTAGELFDAMLYGAHLFHSLRKTWKQRREKFREILESTQREHLLFEMHSTVREMLNYISAASSVMYQDFAHWLHTGSAPRPDVMWHRSVFVKEVRNGEVAG